MYVLKNTFLQVPLHREGESLQRYVYRKQSELQGYMKTFALSIFLLKASTENTVRVLACLSWCGLHQMVTLLEASYDLL